MRIRLTAALSTVLIIAACGGGATDATETTDTAEPAEQSTDTDTTRTPTTTTSPEPTPGPGSITIDDPAGDCGDTGFDLANWTLEATDDGFRLHMDSHGGGEVGGLKILMTLPNGDYYDVRPRADGNHTVDGGGPYAWDAGAQIDFEGSEGMAVVHVTEIHPEPGWTVELEINSACRDLAEGTLS